MSGVNGGRLACGSSSASPIPPAHRAPSRPTRKNRHMTGALRSTARNPVAIALMGLLILVFLVLGVGGNGRFPDLFRVARADRW